MTKDSILSEMEEHFHSLHTVIEKPEYIKISDRNVFRYKNQTVNIAILRMYLGCFFQFIHCCLSDIKSMAQSTYTLYENKNMVS